MKALMLYFTNSLQGSVAKEIKHKAYNMFTYHEQSSTPVRSKHFKIDPRTLLNIDPRTLLKIDPRSLLKK